MKTKGASSTRISAAPEAVPTIDPKPDLTREAIVDAGLEIADTAGLGAVTIRRLANQFHVTPMALYWHVRNKDELLDAMGDRVLEGLAARVIVDGPWQARIRLVLEELISALGRHPGAVTLAPQRILQCSDGLRVTEYTLGLLRSAGMSVSRSAVIARQMLQTAVLLVTAESEASASAGHDATETAQKRDALLALPRAEFPNLVESADALTGCEDGELAGSSAHGSSLLHLRDAVEVFIAGIVAIAGSPSEI